MSVSRQPVGCLRAFLPVAFALVVLAVFFLRRWDQFANPQVWAEDGMIVLPDSLLDGWGSLLYPVQGYFVLTTRLFNLGALALGGLEQYPFWSTLLATGFGVGVLVYLAFTPSLLPRPALFALAAALVPTGVEAFCLPLLAFWWAGLLLFGLVLRADHRSRPLVVADTGLAVFCGLSGVMAPLAAAILAVRVFVFRDRFRGWLPVFVALVATGVAQVAAFARFGSGTAGVASPGSILAGYLLEPFQTVSRTVRVFFGEYLLTGLPGGFFSQSYLFLAGALLILLLARAGRRLRSPLFVYLGLATAGTMALALIRVEVGLLDPHDAAPRYFFYPWIFLTWLLLAGLLRLREPVPRALCAACLFLAAAGLVRSLDRPPHEDLRWEEGVRHLREHGWTRLPFHSNGRAVDRWQMKVFFHEGHYYLKPPPAFTP